MPNQPPTPHHGSGEKALYGRGPTDRRRRAPSGVRHRPGAHRHERCSRRCRLGGPLPAGAGLSASGYPELDALLVRYFVRADAWVQVVDVAQAAGMSVQHVVDAILVLQANGVVRCGSRVPTARAWVLLA